MAAFDASLGLASLLVASSAALVTLRARRGAAPAEGLPRHPIAAFVAQRDDALLLGAIGESIGAMAAGSGLAALPPAARVIALTNAAEYRVGNGGFAYFFEPQEHEAEATLAALRAIEARAAASALQRALAVFPNGRPHSDWQQRMDFLGSLRGKARRQLDAAPSTFASLSALQARYVRAHAEAFAALPSVVDHVPPKPRPAKNAASRAVAIWVLGQGGRAEFAPLQPLASRWSVRNGMSWRSEWRTLAGVHLDEGCREPVALIEGLALLRASQGVERAVVDRELFRERGPALLAALARLPKLRELQCATDSLSPELVRGLARLRSLRRVRLVVDRVPLAAARELASTSRPRDAELVCAKASPAARTILAAGGWVVAP